MSKQAKINTLIDANPDFKDLSDTVRLLKGGEVILIENIRFFKEERY